jgi:hypothetical protein
MTRVSIPIDTLNRRKNLSDLADAAAARLNLGVTQIVTQIYEAIDNVELKPGPPGENGTNGTNGANGATGATGPAGPNVISTSTATAINGLIAGDGTLVVSRPIGVATPSSIPARSDADARYQAAITSATVLAIASMQVGSSPQFFSGLANLTLQATSTRGLYVEGTGGSLAIYVNQSGASRSGTGAGICVDTAAGGLLPFLVGRSSAGIALTTLSGDGSITASGPVRVGPYTFATVPSASANPGATIRITDRSQRLATSDGTAWNWAGTTTAIS